MPLLPEEIYFRVHFDPADTSAKDRTPIVFLHGLMGFAANWGKIWPQFHQERQVLVLDQRGHGKSAKPQSGYAPQDYSEDLKALLQHLGWQKIHLVGHSMGGRVAMIFAELFPELLASLIIEDSGAEAEPSRVKWIRDLLASIPTPFASREAAKDFFQKNFQNDLLTGSFLHSNLETRADGTQDWRFHAPGMIETVATGRAQSAMAAFQKITIPTLLIRGELSHEFPAAEAERMHASRANVELVTIKGAGHYVHSEKPQEFGQAIKAFLAKQVDYRP